jgi:long-chain fatty acid transport protein
MLTIKFKNLNYGIIMKKIFSAIVLIVLLINSNIFATNGYLRHGYGVKYSALSGAGVAIPLSSLGAATNPAGLVYSGNNYELGVALFSPNREYTVTGNPSGFPNTFGLVPGTTKSESNTFYIPTLGATWMINDKSAVGAMVFANGGMNTDYPTATFHDPYSGVTGVNLEQIFFGVTYSIELFENHAFGVTGLFGFQRFAAKGIFAFGNFSTDPNNLSSNRISTSTGFGARIGYMGKLFPFLTVGAAFQTKIMMSEFEKYTGLFAQQGDFDVPANWTVGIAVNAISDFTFALDVQQILYSGVKSVSNPFNPAAFQQGILLGSEEGAGFGWEDMLVIKFGTMWNANDQWTLMFGYSYGKQPIPESEVLFNILAPAVVEHHITFGVTRLIGQFNDLSLALTYSPANTIKGANPMDAPGQQQIELQMSQFQVELGFGFN